MEQATLVQYIAETFPGVDVVVADGNTFFFADGGHGLPPAHRFPFVTLVTSDQYDQASNLNRPSVFRLNIGVGKQTFRTLFESRTPGAADAGETPHDFTALDKIMPHPIYGRMYWICVLNPSNETFDTLRPLLAEAYERSAGK